MEVQQEHVKELLDHYDAWVLDEGKTCPYKVFLCPDGTETTWDAAAIYHLQTLLRSSSMEELIEPDKLKVLDPASGAALLVFGTEDIELFCETDSEAVVNHTFVNTKETISHGMMGLYRLKGVNASSVVVDPPIAEKKAFRENATKMYRLVRRSTYKASNEVSYVINAYRLSQNHCPTMSESKVAQQPIQFEVCVRVCAQLPKEDLIGHIVQLMRLVSRQPMSQRPHAEVSKVLQSYEKTIQKITGIENAPRYFLAPKPVTLEQRHLLSPDYGILSVQEGYAVTEKADGERLLMYISQDKKVYLINNTFQVFDTGYECSASSLIGSLIDGEFVSWDHRKPVASRDLFAIFDVYSKGETPLFEKPLMDRMKVASEIMEHLQKENHKNDRVAMDLSLKNHRVPNTSSKSQPQTETIFDLCKKILYEDHPYHVDGMIFTPLEIPVFSYYTHQAPKFDRLLYRSARWDRLFKWKPSEQNTIDFLVKQVGDIEQEGARYRLFRLFNGQRRGKYESKSISENLLLLNQQRKAHAANFPPPPTSESYIEAPFKPIENYVSGIDLAKIPVSQEGICLDSYDQPISTDSIVEFAYSIPDKCWTPLRVRDDKTRMYRTTKKIGGAANDFEVALNIWRSIHNPVTHSMICGMDKPPRSELRTQDEEILSSESVYYARDVPREYSLSLQMLEFHNLVIKSFLYRYNKRRNSLLELACGKAGDMRRWEECNYSFVLGVDVTKDNIMNAGDGAYARVLQRKRAPRTPVTYAFLVGDVSLPLDRLQDRESAAIWSVLSGKESPKTQELQPLYRQVQSGFDVVSCQFAIHYFFKDQNMLSSFLDNVSKHIKKGGAFIGTCMDGRHVMQMLSESPDGLVEGRKENTAVWAIKKRYNTPVKSPFENKIDVFLEMTQQIIPEYIVDFEHLQKAAAEKGLILEASELFQTTLNNIVEQNNWPVRQTEMLTKSLHTLYNDPILKKFSSLNRWFIFRKK